MEFQGDRKNCSDCHENIHKTFISEKYYPEATCENCHNVNRWNAVNFDHSKTNFELDRCTCKKNLPRLSFQKRKEGVVHQQFMGLPSPVCKLPQRYPW